MIEVAFETLEREVEEAIRKIQLVEDISLNVPFEGEQVPLFVDKEKLRQAAITEVRVNSKTIIIFLDKIGEAGSDINDNLTPIRGDGYAKDSWYRELTSHIGYHLIEIREIPKRLAKGKYLPSWKKIHLSPDDIVK